MPITVIIGGQFGGEGKGKVAHFFAQEKSAHIPEDKEISDPNDYPFNAFQGQPIRSSIPSILEEEYSKIHIQQSEKIESLEEEIKSLKETLQEQSKTTEKRIIEPESGSENLKQEDAKFDN